MEIRVYLDFLRRHWFLLVLGPVTAGLVAFFVTQELTPIYRAMATVLVNRTMTPGVIEYSDILSSERLTSTYAQLVTRPAVLDEVRSRLAIDLSNHDLEGMLAISPVTDTQLLHVSASDPDPVFAAALANTTAQAFAQDNESQLARPGSVSIARPAAVPESPVSPQLLVNLALAVVLGCLLAGGLGLLLDYLDDTVKSAEDIEAVAGLPTLAQIGRFRVKTGPAFATELQSRSAEAYRQLRTNVHFTTLGKDLKTIVITSAHAEEGKSTTAANLATVLAQAGDRVILVDTDLRRASLNETFDGPNSFGLTGLLLKDVDDPALALIATRWKNLRLLPSGVLPPNPSELLTSARMQRLVAQLREMADYVIFDTPPVLAVTDAIVLAARMDGTILVTLAGRTRSEALRMAAQTLKQANARLFGVVLNKAKIRSGDDDYYRGKADQTVEVQAADADAAFVAAITPQAPSGDAVSPARNSEPRRQTLTEWERQLNGISELSSPATPHHSNGSGNGQYAMHANRNGTGNSYYAPRGNGDADGNGEHEAGSRISYVRSAQPDPERAEPQSDAMAGLMSHLDETVDLLRSLRAGAKGRDERGL